MQVFKRLKTYTLSDFFELQVSREMETCKTDTAHTCTPVGLVVRFYIKTPILKSILKKIFI